MIVYHGSTEIVANPLTSVGRDNLDFGKGFYVTDIIEQAISWAKRPLNGGSTKYVNVYNLDMDSIKDEGYKLLSFEAYDKEWLDFVVGNRRGEALWHGFDMIKGGIANDRIFNTVELYSANLISSDEALQRLKYHKPNNQICILNQSIIDNEMQFLKYERL